MKKIIAILFSAISVPVIAAGTLRIADLPNAPEENNPVCHDGNGKLANCAPAAGIDNKYLVPVVVDANGIELGTSIGSTLRDVVVLSDKDYRFSVSYSSGRVSDIVDFEASMYWTESNCQGTAYTNGVSRGNGIVFRHSMFPYPLLYRPHNEEYERKIVAVVAYSGNLECVPITPIIIESYPYYVNDPAVTGVADIGIYAVPISLEGPN